MAAETKLGRDAYQQTALVGLGMYFSAVALLLIAFLIYDPAEAVFLLFFVVPGLITGAGILLWRRWGLIVGIIGSLIGLLFVTEDLDLIVSSPEAFFDFAPTVIAIVGLIVVLVASAVGTVQYLRKSISAQPSATQTRVLQALGAVLVALSAISLVVTVLNMGSASASEAEGAQRVVANHTKWDVERLTASPGEIKVLVKNEDPILHTFTIHALDIDVVIGPWSEEVIVLDGVQPGVYGFVCRIFDHETKMSGVITVQ